MPLVRKMLLKAEDADIVVPIAPNGHYQPTFAVYRKNVLEVMNAVIDGGGRRIREVFDRCRTKTIKVDKDDIVNLNTMEEYKAYQGKSDGA